MRLALLIVLEVHFLLGTYPLLGSDVYETPDRRGSFWNWLSSRDGVIIDMNTLRIQDYAENPTKGTKPIRGIVAGTALEAGAHIASFSLSTAIQLGDMDWFEDDAMMGQGESCSLDIVTLKLAIWLLKEKSLGSTSTYFEWIQLLPKSDAFNLFEWTEKEKSYVSGISLLLSNYESRFNMVHSTFSIAKTAAKIRLSLQEWQWAVSIILSRAFDLSSTSGRHIIPGLDFFNHCPKGSDGEIGFSVSSDKIILTALRSHQRNDPLCFNYGGSDQLLSSQRSLLQYGFVSRHPKNLFDQDQVSLDIQSFCSPKVASLLKERGITKIYIRSTGVDGPSLAALRVAALHDNQLTDGALRRILEEDEPVSINNEKRALGILVDACHRGVGARNTALSKIKAEQRKRKKAKRMQKTKRKKNSTLKRTRNEGMLKNMIESELNTLNKYLDFMSLVNERASEL